MRLIAATMFVLLAVPMIAQDADVIVADRPGLADGSTVVGTGVVQLETGVTRVEADGSALSLPTLVRFGLSDALEIRIESDVYAWTDGENDFAPVGAGVKLRLREGAFPLSLIASVQPPSGGGAFATDDYEAEARLVGDLALSNDFALVPNVGIAFAEGGAMSGILAASLEKSLGNMVPFVDFEASVGNGDPSMIFDAGVAWVVRPNVQLDASAGVNVLGEEYPDWFVAIGYSRRF